MDVINIQGIKDYFVQQDDVEFSMLFGSMALSRNNPMSDIDIAVYFKDIEVLKLADRQIDITCDIMKLCRVNRVDIVVFNTASPFLRFQVLKYGKLLFVRDEKFFYKVKASCFGAYQDIKPMYDLYEKKAEISLRRGLNG